MGHAFFITASKMAVQKMDNISPFKKIIIILKMIKYIISFTFRYEYLMFVYLKSTTFNLF